MRRATLVGLGLFLLAAAGCVTPFKVSTSVSRTEAWSKYARVEVRVWNGSVELQTGKVKDVTITGEEYAWGATLAEAQDTVRQLEIFVGAVASRPDTLLVELRCPEALRHRSVGASLHIELPERCPADVETSNGAIRAKGLSGDVVLRTSNGQVDVSDIGGPVTADSCNGAILARDITGRVQAQTSNAGITVQRVPDAELQTSNGPIEVTDTGRVSARTSNGAIEATVQPPTNGRVDLATSNGTIHVSVPVTLGANVRLETSNGRIRTGLNEKAFKAMHRSQTLVEGELNGGGCRIEATTSNGSITFDTH